MSIRKRAQGVKIVWQVDYRDQTGARRHKQFQTKREADTWLVQARAQVAGGVHTPDSTSITVSDAAALWLARAARDGLERATIRQYKEHVDIHIVPRIGTTKLARLSAPVVNAFVDQLILDGRSKDKGYGPACVVFSFRHCWRGPTARPGRNKQCARCRSG
jgi:integrase